MPAPPGQWTTFDVRPMMGDWSIPMSPAKRTQAEAKPAPAKKARTTPKAEDPKPKKATKTAKAKALEVEPEPQPEPAKPTRKPKVEAAPKAASKGKTEAPHAAPTLSVLAATLLQALQEGRAVELIFSDADSNPPRTFEPRQLVFDTLAQAWFVWGWDRRYNAERHHRVDALAEVNAVEGVGRAAQGPYPEGTPSNQIGGWRGGEPIPVKATLLKQWIFAVKQAPPAFPDFALTDLEDGKAQVTFVGTDLRAIARWCMQFGDGIQVQEPQRLIDRIKQVGVLWGGRPAAPTPAPRPEPKSEPKPEPRRAEVRAKAEPRREEPRREEPRREREESRKEKDEHRTKAARVEVRIERL